MVGKDSAVRTHYRVLLDFSLQMASKRQGLIFSLK